MEALKNKINELGIMRAGNVLDVSNFFNMQVDVELMEAIGKDLARTFENLDIDVVVTVESSGILPSGFAAKYLKTPCLILKKKNELLDSEVYIQEKCISYTHKNEYYITVKKEYLKGKRILFIDDFLAQGQVLESVERLFNKAQAELVGVGICISKNFQDGYKSLVNKPYPYYIQAPIHEIKDKHIEFMK